ncbi:acetyl-CoA carboxylase biotin carboxyl carrier protein [Lactovum odontotermitis]
MDINEVKDLMREFDSSCLREFNWSNATDKISFSKNQTPLLTAGPAVSSVPAIQSDKFDVLVKTETEDVEVAEKPVKAAAEGECVKSPLVGVIYTKPAPDKAEFIQVGDTVKKGQTLLIIEAMKVMNEIPAPQDGIVTEILVSPEEVVEYGQELVRIK